MSWKKHFSPVDNTGGTYSTLASPKAGYGPAHTNYSSYLPDVYTGSPNRIERYQQYEVMDSDPEVNAALDILAEFCTQKLKDSNSPFNIKWRHRATNSEIKTLGEYLQQWSTIQEFNTRIFRTMRNTFKYGDVFFIRDPETQKWSWIDQSKVVKIIVNESDGKKPEQYIVRDIAPNFMNLVATQITPNINPRQNQGGVIPSSGYLGSNASSRGASGQYPMSDASNRFGLTQTEHAINAEHVVHLSLSEGLDNNYPFGTSLLENVFKVYKQKELLEDAILIYRIQRAPERRVFHIDTGGMPPHLAQAFVERIKNEIHQRRIPSQSAGGSNVIDSAYNPMCLDLSTRIPLLDGRVLPLLDLIDEFNEGKQNWAYSCDPATGEIVPGLINWAGITRRNTETIKLTFDNGETLICTPDHKIPVVDKGFVEAKDLTMRDILISFKRRNKSMTDDNALYEQVWDHLLKKWVWTHKMVGDFFRNKNKHQEFTYLKEHISKKKTVIHHKDNNKFNNYPQNLIFMDKDDYILYNASTKESYWQNLVDNPSNNLVGRISKSVQENWENLSNYEKQAALYSIRAFQKKEGYQLVTEIDTEIDTDNTFYEQGYKCGQRKLTRILTKFGYKSRKEFDKKLNQYNYKIVKIEKVDTRDVGTLTIDGHEKYHNYHTFAIESGIFVKNSISEDYFFPTTPDGRGSKVDVLPGGSNLGEIDDLKYFTNKMFRALRIPSSYLPTGADDSQAQFNDGRVGTAYIQELRFNKYCERLQNLVVSAFDQEFKIFINSQGINIDSNLFELQFNPPMNFASSRQATIDSERINTFNTIQAIPFVSKRFALKRFLGLTDDEVAENERMWGEESGNGSPTSTDSAGELRGAGISAAGINSDIMTAAGTEAPPSMEIPGEDDYTGALASDGMPAGETANSASAAAAPM